MYLRNWRSHSLMTLASLLLSLSIQAQSLRILPNLDKERITGPEIEQYLSRITDQEGMTFEVLRENKQRDGNFIQFQQYYHKIPIDAARVTAHVKNGILHKLVGKWVDEPLTIDVNAHHIENQAIEKGKGYTGFRQFKWDDPAAPSALKTWRGDKGATYFPQPRLVITKGDNLEGAYRLAYTMDIASLESTESYKVLIDATTGDLIYKVSNTFDCTSGGQATSAFLGNYGIRTNSTINGFHLYACQNSTDIHTLRFDGFDLGNPFNGATEYFDADNVWNSSNPEDQYMTDVHFGLSYSNSFFNNLGVNPFAGQDLMSVVNVPIDNAYYQGPPSHFFVIGVGQAHNLPFVCLDVIAHEYTHSVSLALAGWNTFFGEPAAINESLSDIFGSIIQGTYSGQDWHLGECIGNTMYERDLSNPNANGGADTYQGLYWASGDSHVRGGVGNFWFYLLTNGGTGTNDNNDDYDVDGIGLQDAQTLIWNTLNNYIGPNVTFEELRALTLQAATDLWGACSPQYISCMNAWHAVGVGIPYIGGAPQNLVADPVGVCLATLCWENTGYQTYWATYWPINTFNFLSSTHISSTDSIICVTVEVNPHTQYVWEVAASCDDFVEVSPEATFTTNDICGQVTNLEISDVTYCGALVTWDFPIAHHFLVEVAPAASMDFTLIPPVTTTTNSVQITGLSPNTQYVVRVTVFCCEDFDGQAVLSHKFTTPDLECTIPPFGVSVTPCHIFINFSAQPGQLYSVEFSNGGTGFYPFSGIILTTTPETEYTFRLRVQCGNGTCSSVIFSDWMTVITPPLGSCEPPTDLTAVPGSGFPGVQFFWNGGNSASTFRIRYRTSPTANFDELTTTTLNFYLGTFSNYYELCVASVCGCGGEADPLISDEICLTYTIDDCLPPAIYDHQIICPDQVWVHWGHVLNKDRYFVEYSSDGIHWMTVNPYPYLGANDAFLSNLDPDSHYYWRVRTRCIGGSESDWGPIQEFDTPPACQEVSNVAATVDGDQVSISWTPSPINDYTTSFYEIRYRLAGTSTWNTPAIIIDETSYVRDLPCGTYEYQVRAHCGSCGASEWSTLDTFTIECDNECGNGLHIAKDPTAICDPCKDHSGCYVCIYDANGVRISIAESIYEIDWTVPGNYPIPANQLTNNECIPMGYDFEGETFTATVRLYDIVNGYKTLRCETELHFTLDCREGGGHDGGGGEIGGGHLAPPNGGNTGQGKNTFRVYPNPTSSTLLISSNSTDAATAIFYDAFGKELREITLRAGETIPVDVSDWSSGMYFIKITDESGKQSYRQSIVITR